MMNEKNIFGKLSKMKVFPYLLLALAAGIILLIYPSGSGTKTTKVEQKSVEEYTIRLEKELEELIERIGGVKWCKVMVYADESFSYLYASDQELEYDGERRKVSKKVVTMTKDGENVPIVIEEYLPTLAGVAVVAGGADEYTLAMIKNMLSVLLDLDESRIFITR